MKSSLEHACTCITQAVVSIRTVFTVHIQTKIFWIVNTSIIDSSVCDVSWLSVNDNQTKQLKPKMLRKAYVFGLEHPQVIYIYFGGKKGRDDLLWLLCVCAILARVMKLSSFWDNSEQYIHILDIYPKLHLSHFFYFEAIENL